MMWRRSPRKRARSGVISTTVMMAHDYQGPLWRSWTTSTFAILKPAAINSLSRCSTFMTKARIAPNRRNGLAAQPREIIRRERQTGDPARVDVKCDLLAQFYCPSLADQKILARALRTLVLSPGCCVEDDCKACIALTPSRGAQHNVRGRSRSAGLAKRKIAEDVIAATKHQRRRPKRLLYSAERRSKLSSFSNPQSWNAKRET